MRRAREANSRNYSSRIAIACENVIALLINFISFLCENLHNAPVVQEDGYTRAIVNLVTVVTVHWKTIHGQNNNSNT